MPTGTHHGLPSVYDTWKDNRGRTVYTWKSGAYVEAQRAGEHTVRFGSKYFWTKIAHDWTRVDK